GFEGSYLEGIDDSRTPFNLDLRPNEKSLQSSLVEVVSRPRGRERNKLETVTVTNPDGSVETTTTHKVTNDKAYTLSAQYAYHLGDAQVRAGLIESSGGVGIDYSLLDQHLKLSFDAYQFN